MMEGQEQSQGPGWWRSSDGQWYPPTVSPSPTLVHESLDSQVDRLAEFITERVPGEPSQPQGAIDTAIRLLDLAYPPSKRVTRACSKCGMLEPGTEELEWPGLIDISVITAGGEEGYAYVTQLLCANCWGPMIDAIKALGFVDHHHGGINYLEADCVPNAYANCPVSPGPVDGRYVVGMGWVQ